MRALPAAAVMLATAAPPSPATPRQQALHRRRLRTGNRLPTGFDPTAKGFYRGGDLAGLARRPVAFDTSAAAAAQVEEDVASTRFHGLAGTCPARASAPGSVAVSLPAVGDAVCAGWPG